MTAPLLPAGVSLRVSSIGEPEDNMLRITVQQALPVGSIFETEVGRVREIRFTERSPTYEVVWDSYVAYCVRDESFAFEDPATIADGARLFCRDASPFLDHVAATTIARDGYPGALANWTLLTSNHAIDVVSWVEPTVRRL